MASSAKRQSRLQSIFNSISKPIKSLFRLFSLRLFFSWFAIFSVAFIRRHSLDNWFFVCSYHYGVFRNFHRFVYDSVKLESSIMRNKNTMFLFSRCCFLLIFLVADQVNPIETCNYHRHKSQLRHSISTNRLITLSYGPTFCISYRHLSCRVPIFHHVHLLRLSSNAILQVKQSIYSSPHFNMPNKYCTRLFLLHRDVLSYRHLFCLPSSPHDSCNGIDRENIISIWKATCIDWRDLLS